MDGTHWTGSGYAWRRCSVGNLCRGCTRVTSAPSSVSPLSESATENSSGNALSASSASCTACVVDECLQNERIPPRPAPEHSRYRRGYDFKVLIAGLASAHMSHHERAVKSRLLPYSAYVAEGSLAGSLGAPSVCACRMRSASSLRRWRSRSLRSSSFLSLYACQTCLIFPCAHAERSLHSRLSRSVSYCRILCRAFRASIPYQPIFIPSPQKLADSNRRCSHHRPRDTSKHQETHQSTLLPPKDILFGETASSRHTPCGPPSSSRVVLPNLGDEPLSSPSQSKKMHTQQFQMSITTIIPSVLHLTLSNTRIRRAGAYAPCADIRQRHLDH